MEPIAQSTRKRPMWFRIMSCSMLSAVVLCVAFLFLLTSDTRLSDWLWRHASRPRVIGHLVDKFFSRDPDRSKDAEKAILALHDEQDIYTLIRYAARQGRRGDDQDRLCVVIGRIGEPAVLPLYKTLVAANYELNALERKSTYTGGGPFRYVDARFAAMKEHLVAARFHVAWQSLYSIGKPAVRPLLGFISDPREIERAHALRAMRGVNDPEAVLPVIALATSSTDRIRYDALDTLADQRSPLAADTFAAILAQAPPSPSRVTVETQVAAIGLGRLKDVRALPWLVRIAADDGCTYQWSAAACLGEYRRQEAESVLIKILRSHRGADPGFDLQMKQAAADSLKKIGTPAALKAISDAGMNPPAPGDGEARDVLLPLQSTANRADTPSRQ